MTGNQPEDSKALNAMPGEGGATRVVYQAEPWLSITSIGRHQVRWRIISPTCTVLAIVLG